MLIATRRSLLSRAVAGGFPGFSCGQSQHAVIEAIEIKPSRVARSIICSAMYRTVYTLYVCIHLIALVQLDTRERFHLMAAAQEAVVHEESGDAGENECNHNGHDPNDQPEPPAGLPGGRRPLRRCGGRTRGHHCSKQRGKERAKSSFHTLQ